MSEVVLTGVLVCADDEQAEIVERHLPRHVELTRDEDGCVSFDVERLGDSLVWQVRERFRDRTAFDAHQRRVAESEWGAVTAGIERQYEVDDHR